jgi:hypothetical protein
MTGEATFAHDVPRHRSISGRFPPPENASPLKFPTAKHDVMTGQLTEFRLSLPALGLIE